MNKLVKAFVLGLVLVCLPCLVYAFARETRIGPIMAILPWAEHAGVHLGDVVFAATIAPFWWLIGKEFVRTLRRRYRRRRRLV